MKEHKKNELNGREKTAIAIIVLNKNINYNKTKKLANYKKRKYAYCCKALEIASINQRCLYVGIFPDFRNFKYLYSKVPFSVRVSKK